MPQTTNQWNSGFKLFVAVNWSMEILLYTKDNCPYCERLKVFLKEHNVGYVEINVSRNKEAENEVLEKTGQQGVPVLELENEIIVGFNKKAIVKALNLQ